MKQVNKDWKKGLKKKNFNEALNRQLLNALYEFRKKHEEDKDNSFIFNKNTEELLTAFRYFLSCSRPIIYDVYANKKEHLPYCEVILRNYHKDEKFSLDYEECVEIFSIHRNFKNRGNECFDSAMKKAKEISEHLPVTDY